MTATSPLDLFRPFLWIAAVAFVLGFAGYALLGAGSLARSTDGRLAPTPVEAPQAPPIPVGPTISA